MAKLMRGNSVSEVSLSFDLLCRGNAKRDRGGGSSLDQPISNSQAFVQRYTTCNQKITRIARSPCPIATRTFERAQASCHLLLNHKSGRAWVSHLALT